MQYINYGSFSQGNIIIYRYTIYSRFFILSGMGASVVYQIFTPAFISFRGCLYLCILFLLLQPKAAQNEPVPLGAMLTKGAVRDNLPPVARALVLHEFEMASHVKTRSNTSCY